jgi:hypothetical protein
MSYEFPELLHVDGTLYHLYAYPLDRHLATMPDWPRHRKTPWNSRGYSATWAVVGDVLALPALNAPGEDPLRRLFPAVPARVPGFWVDGLLHGYHGDRRHVGYPSRQIFDDEIVLEVKAGRITRAWRLDLRRVPDKTDEEFKLSVPEFLWPARLRGGKATPHED